MGSSDNSTWIDEELRGTLFGRETRKDGSLKSTYTAGRAAGEGAGTPYLAMAPGSISRLAPRAPSPGCSDTSWEASADSAEPSAGWAWGQCTRSLSRKPG